MKTELIIEKCVPRTKLDSLYKHLLCTAENGWKLFGADFNVLAGAGFESEWSVEMKVSFDFNALDNFMNVTSYSYPVHSSSVTQRREEEEERVFFGKSCEPAYWSEYEDEASSDDEVLKLCEQYWDEEGYSYTDISDYCVSFEEFCAWFVDMGFIIKEPLKVRGSVKGEEANACKRRITEREIISLYESGCSVKEIANVAGITKGRVYQILSQNK